jgi:hypothetical protein
MWWRDNSNFSGDRYWQWAHYLEDDDVVVVVIIIIIL